MIKNQTTKKTSGLRPAKTGKKLTPAQRTALSNDKVQRLIQQNRELRAPLKEDKDTFKYNRFGRLMVALSAGALLVQVLRTI